MAEIGIQILVTGAGVARSNLGAFESDLRRVQTEINATADKSNFLTTRLLNLGNSMSQIGASVLGLGRTLSIGLTAPIIAFGAQSVKSGMEFESAFAGVAKTVDGVADSTGRLTDMGRQMQSALLTMGMDFATPVNDLAKIAEIGGQLRVPADSLLEFTKIIAQTVIASDLSAQDAAFNVARIGNIYGIASEDITGFADKFTNALVFLGNTSAATESEITATVTRIASSARQLGISAADTLGIAATIAGIGARPELGGTAVQRIFLELLDAATAAVDSDKVQQFAAILGVTGEEFQNLVKSNPTEAFTRVLKSLSSMQQAGGNMRDVLEGVDLTGIRLIDVIGRLTGATGVLERNILGANEAWNTGTARQEEFNKRSITLESSIIELKNSFVALGFTLEKLIGPTLVFIIEGIKNVIRAFMALPESVQRTIIGFALAAAAIGPLLVAIGGIIGIAGAAVSAIAAYGGAVLGLIPIFIPIIALAAAFVAGIMQIVNSNADIEETSDAFSTFGRQIEVSSETIQNVLTDLANNPFIKAMKDFVQGIANTVQERWPEIEAAFYRLKTAITELLLVFQHNTGPLFARLFNMDTGESVADFIINTLIWAIDLLSSSIHNLTSFIESPLGQTIFRTIYKIVSELPLLIDKVITKIEEFVDKLVSSPVTGTIISTIKDILEGLPQQFANAKSEVQGFIDTVGTIADVVTGRVRVASPDAAAETTNRNIPIDGGELQQAVPVVETNNTLLLALQTIIDKFNEVKDTVTNTFRVIMEKITEVVDGIVSGFLPHIPEITEGFGEVKTNATIFLETIRIKILEVVGMLQEMQRNIDKADFSVIGETLGNLGGEGTIAGLSIIDTILRGWINLMVDLGPLRDLINDIKEAVGPIVEDFKGVASKQIQDAIHNLTAAFEVLGVQLSDRNTDMFTLRDVIIAVAQVITFFAGLIIVTITGAISLISSLAYVVAGVVSGIKLLFVGVIAFFEGVGMWFKGVTGLIKITVETLIALFFGTTEEIKGILERFTTEANKNIDLMVNGFIRQLNGLLNIFASIFFAIGGVISTFVVAAIQSLKNFAYLVLGIFGGLGDELVYNSIIPDMVNEILRWFGMLVMNNPMAQFADNFISEAQGLASRVAPIMANIASTVANAVSALSGGNINIPVPSMGSFASSSGESKAISAPSTNTAKASSIATVKPASSASYSSTSSKTTTLNVKTVPVKNEREFGRVANKILNTLAY